MINNNNNDNEKEKKINNNLSLINNELSSGEKRIIKIQNQVNNLIIDSLNNLKLKEFPKEKFKNAKNKYKQLSNYSFSNKESGNELSKKYFETLEKETIDLDRIFNHKLFTKDVPIYINHSDYFYCPNSMKEKNLNIQIMKYLYQNNLIKNDKHINQNNLKKNKIHKMKKNNSFKLSNGIILKKNNTIFNLKESNSNTIIINNNESKFLNKSQKEKINNNISESDEINYDIKYYLKQIDNNKINNIKIKYINNIKNNNNIYTIEKQNNIDKPKENFYSFRTGKIINDYAINNNKLSSSNFYLSNSSSSNKKLMSNQKIKKKSKKSKMIIPIDFKKMNYQKSNNSQQKDLKEKNIMNNCNNNNQQKSFKNVEISTKVVNEQIGKKKKNNDSSDISRISLQTMNDSKIFELAENIIPKDEELEKFKANEFMNKRKNFK